MKKKDNQPISWTPGAEQAFVSIKDKQANSITLCFLDFSKNFVLTTDSFDISIRGILQQYTQDNTLCPITFFCQKLNSAGKKYSIVEREGLAVVYGLQINRPVILGYPVEIHTNHRPLVWLLQVVSPNGSIA